MTWALLASPLALLVLAVIIEERARYRRARVARQAFEAHVDRYRQEVPSCACAHIAASNGSAPRTLDWKRD